MSSISESIRHTPFLLGQLLDRPVALYPERAALEWEDGALTFSQLARRITEREQALRRLGARRFARWGVCLPNSADFLITLFALVRAGCTVAPLRESPLMLERFGQAVREASLRAVVFSSRHPSLTDLAAGASEAVELGDKLTVLFFDEQATGRATREELPDTTTGSEACIDLDPALILWTSGSTGNKQGIVLQHHAILANIAANIAALGFRDEDRTLVVLPLAHAYALVHQALCHWAVGATICLPPAPLAPPLLCRSLERFRITTLATVPPVLKILTEGVRQSRLACRDLRLVTVGAAPAPAPVVRDFFELLPHAQLAVTYGLTEAGPRVASCFVTPEDFASGCVGQPLPNTEVRVERAGDEARFVVRSRSLMRGYAHEPYEEGDDYLLRTTDEGYIEDGQLHFAGRGRRVINRGGSLLVAETIERALEEHASVERARVVAEAHPFWGEVPLAHVNLRAGCAPTTVAELERHCAARLLCEERPARIIIVSPAASTAEPLKEQQMLTLFQAEQG